MDFKKTVAQKLSEHLLPLGYAQDKIVPMFVKPPKPEMGDFSFPCFGLARELKKNPAELAQELKKKIGKISGIEKIDTAGPYLNFFVDSAKQSAKVISDILKQKEKYGTQKQPKKTRTMIEYSGPNTNKPLHIGHLRNDSIGMMLSNLLDTQGHTVIRANILSNRGIHICKSMLAYQKFGNGATPKSEMKKSDHFVGDYYVRFAQEAEKNPALNSEAQAMLEQWEKNDKAVRALWKKMNKWAVDGFKDTYKRFGSRFDVWFSESDFFNSAKPILEKGLSTGVFEKTEDGAIIARLEKHGLPDKVVLRRDATSLYVTNDLALTPHKVQKYKLDSNIWIVANEQNLYFQQLIKIFELLGYTWANRCRHVAYGLVHLPEGRLKSREGNVVDADNLMDEMTKLAASEVQKRFPDLPEKEIQKRAAAIGLSAIKFFMLKFDHRKDFVFNPSESLSFEGETGPYLLYTYARAKSILRKAKGIPTANYALLSNPSEKQIVSLLAEFPGKLKETSEHLSPHLLCHYLISLAAAFNSFYHELPVLTADTETKNARTGLVSATALVLQHGLNILGIETLEKM